MLNKRKCKNTQEWGVCGVVMNFVKYIFSEIGRYIDYMVFFSFIFMYVYYGFRLVTMFLYIRLIMMFILISLLFSCIHIKVFRTAQDDFLVKCLYI